MVEPLKKEEKKQLSQYEARLCLGEAWMWCVDCGAKLYSFDGNEDGSRKCPYMRHGKCEP
jgi:hypothetical protein